MASRMGCLLGCVLVIAALLQGAAAQRTHVVLGTEGWIIPPNQSAYTTWATSQTFSVGDILEFNFPTGSHDVAKVSKADYGSCTKTNPLGSIKTQGPANVSIDAAGDHYYICTIATHCEKGQKLTITTTTSSPSPSTAPPPSNTNVGTPPSSASSLTVGGFSLLLLSAAIAFFY